jgi:hypothetical protein
MSDVAFLVPPGDGEVIVAADYDPVNGFVQMDLYDHMMRPIATSDTELRFTADPNHELYVRVYGTNTRVLLRATQVAPSPLLAAGGQGPGAAALTPGDLAGVVEAAIDRWSATGLGADDLALLNQVTVNIADLPNGQLGSTVGTHIDIDRDAAGHGWYVDPVPGNDREFRHFLGGPELRSRTGASASRMDLLTGVMHEMGHVLGFSNVTMAGHAHPLMTASLPAGRRRLPDDSLPVWSSAETIGFERLPDSAQFRISVMGGSGADRLQFSAANPNSYRLVLNGQPYLLATAAVSSVAIDGGDGGDVVVLTDSAGADEARLYPTYGTLTGPGFDVSVAGAEKIRVFARTGDAADHVSFFDSTENDRFVARGARRDAFMKGPGFLNYARFFERCNAFAEMGGDKDMAYFYDSKGNDRYVARSARQDAFMKGTGFFHYARDFDRFIAVANAGGVNDVAVFQDSADNDLFRGRPRLASLRNETFFSSARGFDRVKVTSATTTDVDRAVFFEAGNRRISRARFESLADYVLAMENDWLT